MFNFRITAIVTFLGYILLYGVCWGTDKTDIEKYKKKIKLNKYTSILFFLWQRNEKVPNNKVNISGINFSNSVKHLPF